MIFTHTCLCSSCHFLIVLQVGTEKSPFQHTARITLHGTVRDPEIPIYGAKVYTRVEFGNSCKKQIF